MPDTPIIPRDVLWGNPDRVSPRLSPDGSRIAYVAPADGILNVWVAPADDPESAQPVSRETKRPIGGFRWTATSRHLLYVRDQDGDENWHVVRVDLETGDVKDLTPYEGVQAQIERVSHRHPDIVAIGMNDRDPELHDVYAVNVVTGERTLVEENPGLVDVLVDMDLKPRFASRFTEDGGVDVLTRGDDGWEPWARVDQQDSATFDLIDVDETGAGVLAVDARGRDTAALVRIAIDGGEVTTIAESEHADVEGALLTRRERRVLAASVNRERTTWTVVDESVADDFERLAEIDPGDVNVVSQTADDRRWVLAYMHDDGPVSYYVYDRDTKSSRFLFSHREDLKDQPLASMRPVIIRSRDGLNLVSYLSLPRGAVAPDYDRPVQPLPMVLLVHGGPWARDHWGYNPIHQMLANRGYAVLSVNFRGSTGFGKPFLNAGDREWARKMHDDLLDGVEWAVNSGIADPRRVAIMGGSYGGYATLVGLTMTPEVFACGVDIVGPSSLQTLIASMPPYWKPAIQMFRERVGDERTEEGRALLDERSPIHHVDAIRRPLLIAQGANDPRVKQQESDQIVAAMQAKKIPVTYALFPDEGHGFARPQNNRAFFAAAEAFLAEHLGGRIEPLAAADFEGSSIEIRAGLDGVPGIAEVLPGVA